MILFNLIKNIQKENSRNLITIILLSVLMLFVGSSVQAGGGPNVTGAKLYIKQNDLDQALKVLLKEIEEVNPKNEDAWYLLGYIYGRQRKYDKMMEAFNKAIELKPKFKEKGLKVSGDPGPQFHAEHGVDVILRVIWGNAVNAAVKYFNEAIAATTDTAKTFGFEKAVKYFEVATQVMPDSTIAYRNMAAALINMGKYEESIEPLTIALQRNPDDEDTGTMLASIYMTTGRDSLALPILQNLWDKGSRTVEVSDYLARIYLKAGDNEKAVAIYKEALETNPDNFQFLYNYGVILLEAKDYDAAIEQFQKAYELNPESPDLNYNLGAAYLNRGVSKREALPEDSEDKSYVEDFRSAFPYLEKSISMNPSDTEVWYTLGRISGQLNKMALAGYAISKGEETKSAFENKIVVGMQSSDLKMIFGEPDDIRNVESDVISGIEEWVYKKRPASKGGKLAVPESVNVYVKNGRVDALMVLK